MTSICSGSLGLEAALVRALCVMSLSLVGQTHAESADHCSIAATEQAKKLLEFHFGHDRRIEIDGVVKKLAPIANPANKQQSFDLVEVWGYVHKGRYRMRLIYARLPGECLLMGQEIIEYADL